MRRAARRGAALSALVADRNRRDRRAYSGPGQSILPPDGCELAAGFQLIVAETILSGSLTGSPRLILSTFSMPEITLPHTVYCLSRKRASVKQMKNCELAEAGFCARAMEQVPRTCGSELNSALRFGYFEPPVPVPFGHPVCAMKPSITRWKTIPS